MIDYKNDRAIGPMIYKPENEYKLPTIEDGLRTVMYKVRKLAEKKPNLETHCRLINIRVSSIISETKNHE